MNNYITLAVLFWGLAISSSAAENAPRFENGILSIPRVDTPEQPGQYENARFSLAPDGRWDLLHAEAGRQAVQALSAPWGRVVQASAAKAAW